MVYNKYFTYAILVGLIGAAPLTACSTVLSSTPAKSVIQVAQVPTVIEFKKGQLFSITSIVPKAGEEAKLALAQYYKTAFPLGDKYGLKREGQLQVNAVPVGGHKAKSVIIFSWPDAESEAQFIAEPEWSSIKSLRSKAWEELRIYTEELDDDLTLTFDPNKTYTLAMAWINPENPDDYDLYMDGIKDAVSDVGGRFVYKMFDPKFESNKIKAGGPGQVTLVEWDTPEGLKKFGETRGFKQNAHYITSGVTRFEIMVLSTS